MDNLKLALRNQEEDPKSWQTFKEKLIEPKIRENSEGYSSNQEAARFRKAIMLLLDLYATEHPDLLEHPEYIKFKKYCDDVNLSVKICENEILEKIYKL